MDPRAIAVLLLGVVFAIAGMFDYLLSYGGFDNFREVFSNFDYIPTGLVTKFTAFLTGGGSALKSIDLDAELTFETSPLIQLSFNEPAQVTLNLMDERTNFIKIGPSKKGVMDLALKEGVLQLRGFYGSLSLAETIELEGTLSEMVIDRQVVIQNQLTKLYMMGYGLKFSEARLTNSSLKDIYLPPTSGTVSINNGAVKCSLKNRSIVLPEFIGDLIFYGDSIVLRGKAKISSIDAICGG